MRRAAWLLLFATLGCTRPDGAAAPKAAEVRGLVRPGTPPSVDIARARTRGAVRTFEWAPWTPETFERAARERKLVLIDAAAEWCHWCHVMDATTYTDAEIGRILKERFVAIRVDVDARPDIEERYGDWGWPATIILSPDGEELGKYKGYLPPEELAPILRAAADVRLDRSGGASRSALAHVPRVEALAWIAGRALLDMDDYFDAEQGGWGFRQKSPLGANAEVELRRHALGDANALRRALLSLERQRALIDPVWGGVYQYSSGRTWNEPHYEKLMHYQAQNLVAYARAYQVTRDPKWLADARSIAAYIKTFLSSPEGGFFAAQDADVGAHDARARFVDGDVYYRLDDARRRALGIPRVDPNVYAQETGLAIEALCTLHEAAGDRADLARAVLAADRMLAAHVSEGRVRRDAKSSATVRYLADAAALGWALSRLAEATGDVRWREAALRIAETMLRDFAGEASNGALVAHTPDPAAVGVFRTPTIPFHHNVVAARFLAALARATNDSTWRDRARSILAAVASPKSVADQGRMLGHFLLALDEVGATVNSPRRHGDTETRRKVVSVSPCLREIEPPWRFNSGS